MADPSPTPAEQRAGASPGPADDGAHQYVTPAARLLTGEQLRDADPTPRFRIGEVAERIGLSLRSIRYYEEAGLVTPAARTSGGFRMYSEVDVQRLLGIMHMKPLGFSLERMGEVLTDLDLLRNVRAEPQARRSARDRLTHLQEEMAARLADLAQALEIARSFTSTLDTELSVLGDLDQGAGR